MPKEDRRNRDEHYNGDGSCRRLHRQHKSHRKHSRNPSSRLSHENYTMAVENCSEMLKRMSSHIDQLVRDCQHKASTVEKEVRDCQHKASTVEEEMSRASSSSNRSRNTRTCTSVERSLPDLSSSSHEGFEGVGNCEQSSCSEQTEDEIPQSHNNLHVSPPR